MHGGKFSSNSSNSYPKLTTKLKRERRAQVFRVTARLVWGNGSFKFAELLDQTLDPSHLSAIISGAGNANVSVSVFFQMCYNRVIKILIKGYILSKVATSDM